MKGKQEMPTNADYILRLILQLIDQCESLEELREAVRNVLQEEA